MTEHIQPMTPRGKVNKYYRQQTQTTINEKRSNQPPLSQRDGHSARLSSPNATITQ